MNRLAPHPGAQAAFHGVPPSAVAKAMASISAAKPLTTSLRRLGCKLIQAEVEAKDAWSGRNDGYDPRRRARCVGGYLNHYGSVYHYKCRARLGAALIELRCILAAIKEQTL